MKLGEKIFFGFAVLLTIAGVSKGIKQFKNTELQEPRDFYEWTDASSDGHALYLKMGCNSCHRAFNVGEIGVAPVLDGEGTKRELGWLQNYFINPGKLVPGTAHDGSLGPDFRNLTDNDRVLLTAFLFALKSNPGSRNYPRPPT
jgi:cbb3-type cytochrome oxidase cytochrome c subunit